MGFIIVLAAPIFFLAVAFEWWWGWRLSRQGQASSQTYRWDDAINSISLGIISQLSAVFTRLLRITIYTLVFEQVALFPQPEFWNTWYGVLIALVFPAFGPFSGAEYSIIGFIVIVLGGLGNPMGALIAGIFYGIAEQMATVFLAQALAQIVGFGMLVVTILVRPTGLFGFRVLR